MVEGGGTAVYLGKDYEVEGGVSAKHIFLGDRRITTKKSDGEIQFIHEDHISSSNVITDASGNQSALIEYTPYGSTATHTGSADPRHKFTGQEEDPSTSLYYYGARYYDPQLGRFVTADPTIQHPTDPQDFNRYAYARNNPIKYNDPTGYGWLSKLFAFVAAVVTSYFTGGGTLLAWIAIIGAGALGGLAGAAIEKSSLAKGAIQGAMIGASVAANASASDGGSNGGENIVGYEITEVEMVVGYTEAGEAVIKNYTYIRPIIKETSSPLIANVIGSTLAFAGQSASEQLPETRRPREVQQKMQESYASGYQLSAKALDKILRKTEGLNGNIMSRSNPVAAAGGFGTGGQGALAAEVFTVSQAIATPVPVDGYQARNIGKWIATIIRTIVAAAGILSGQPEEEPQEATYKNLKNKTTVEEIYDPKKEE